MCTINTYQKRQEYNFSYEGSLAVGEMLRGNKYLRELDISNNRINWEGALLISKGLKENDTLETFEVRDSTLTKKIK